MCNGAPVVIVWCVPRKGFSIAAPAELQVVDMNGQWQEIQNWSPDESYHGLVHGERMAVYIYRFHMQIKFTARFHGLFPRSFSKRGLNSRFSRTAESFRTEDFY